MKPGEAAPGGGDRSGGWRRAAGRVLVYLAVLWAAFTLNFLLPHVAPGDPISYYLAPSGGLSEEQVEQVAASLGLDGTLVQQYGRYWADLARGDLGRSVRFNRPVAAVLWERVPWTVLLVGTAVVTSAAAGIAGAAAAAMVRGRRTDVGLLTVFLTLDAMPAFWIGMVLIGIFAVSLGVLPSFGAAPLGGAEGFAWVLGVARRLVLPVATITLATAGGTFLLTRGALAAVLDQPYIRLLQATGVPPGRLLWRHALRNALLPTYTHLTLAVGALLGGAVVVETVFAYPGVGRLIYEGVIGRDYQLVRGAFLLLTVGVIGTNLVADLSYPLLDPRVRRHAPQRR